MGLGLGIGLRLGLGLELSVRAMVCVGSAGEPHWCEPLSLCCETMSAALMSPG